MCKGFLAIAIVIGAAFFSVTASATLVPLAPTYDATTHVVTIGVRIVDGFPNSDLSFIVRSGPRYANMRTRAIDGVGTIALEGFPVGVYVIEVSDFGPNTMDLTFDVQDLGWVPTVLGLLCD